MHSRTRSPLTSILAIFAVITTLAVAPALGIAEEGAPAESTDLFLGLESRNVVPKSDDNGVALFAQAAERRTRDVTFSSAKDANTHMKLHAKDKLRITMTADWKGTTVKVPSDADVTIYMNGYAIDRAAKSGGRNDSAIQVGKNAKLTIYGSTQRGATKRTFKIYRTGGSYTTMTRDVYGLITGGYNTNGGGGIEADAGASVELCNLYIAGNRAEQNWGTSGHGGAFYGNGENIKLTLNDVHVMGNYAYNSGGGIYANNSLFMLTLVRTSIDGNVADRGNGGGIQFDSDKSHVLGDGKSSVRYNFAKGDGGGIYLNKSGSSVRDTTIEYNRAEGTGGGGIWADSKEISFSDLKVTNNSATNGAGIYITKEATTISGCTITNNRTFSGSFGTGGGVLVSKDITNGLSIGGTSIIKDNGGGNYVLAKGARVNVDLARGSDVHMGFATFSGTSMRVTPNGAQSPNCIRYLTSDNNAHFTYNANNSVRAIFLVAGNRNQNNSSATGEPAREYQKPTAIAASDAAPTKTSNVYNGREVQRGYVRFPNFEDTSAESATSFYYSDGYFLDNPTKYNEHLATTSLCMAMSGFYLNAGSTNDYTNKHASARQFFADIGCADNDIYVNDFNVQKPGTNTIGVTIASKTIWEGPGKDFTLVPIAVRGAGYEAEWASNVTLGGEAMAEAAGFADAANKVTSEVNSYLARNNLTQKAKQGKVKFWIAGYSRAGATSNLTARRLLDQYASGANKCDVFAYTFEAPQGGTDKFDKANPQRYYSIHNIINKADLVPLVAPTLMGFKRYGVDHYLPGDAAGNVRQSTTTATRSGENAANRNPSKNGHERGFLPGVTSGSTVTSRFDNNDYSTTSSGYASMRPGMVTQLEAVDPSILFDDFFSTADMDFFPSPTMRYKKTSKPEDSPTMEKFINDFVGDVQHWGIGDRYSYNQTLQRPFQDVIGTVFSMDKASSEGFVGRASTVMDRFSKIGGSSVTKMEIYRKVIRNYHGLNEKERERYKDAVATRLEQTGAYDYLTPEQKAKVKGSIPQFLDFAFRFVNGDWENKSYNTTKCMMVPTFALNTSRIMANHYPEINLAWLRANDSYYKDDKTAYIVSNGAKPAQPSALENKKQLKATEKNELAEGKHRITLDVVDLKGEAIYYKVTKAGKTISKNTCKNGYDIYRGGIDINVEDRDEIKVIAYAMSYGTKSDEVTYTIARTKPLHKVTVYDQPSAMNGGNPKSYEWAEETSQNIVASPTLRTNNTVYKFYRWDLQSGAALSNEMQDRIIEGRNNPTAKVNMPVGGANGLSKTYSITIKAMYKEEVRNDNLHKVTIRVGQAEVVRQVREGESFTYEPTIPAGKVFTSWQASISGTGTTESINKYLEPQTTYRGKTQWAGVNRAKLEFISPRAGIRPDSRVNYTYPANYSLEFVATLTDERVNTINVTNIPEVGPGLKDVATIKYVTNGSTPINEMTQPMAWDARTTTVRNKDNTQTKTTTMTTYIDCPKRMSLPFANNNELNVSLKKKGEIEIDFSKADTNGGRYTKTIERKKDGSLRIKLEYVRKTTEGDPSYRVDVKAYDINDAEKEPIRGKDGELVATECLDRTEQNKTFEPNWGPGVPGGESTWTYVVPEGSGLSEVEESGGKKFTITDESKDLVLLLAHKPAIDKVEVKAFPAPKTGEPLAVVPDGGSMTDAISFAYGKPGESIFADSYTPKVESITWTPAAPTEGDDAGKAAGNTQYSAAVKLGCADGKQIHFNNTTSVSVVEGVAGITSAKFDASKSTLYLTFDRTARVIDHEVTVKADAEEGDPVASIWKEGEVKSVTAKDDYEDKFFTGWTVRVNDRVLDPNATDAEAAAQNKTALQQLGLFVTGEGDSSVDKRSQRTVKVTLPKPNEDGVFAAGYTLSLTANYQTRADEVLVGIAWPTAELKDLADEATLSWIVDDETIQNATVPVSWTATEAYSETQVNHTFVANMRLDAATARQFMRSENGEARPKVIIKKAGSDEENVGTANWNADGTLTITATFGPIASTLPAYKVSIGRYDANNYDVNNPDSKLVGVSDVDQIVVDETGDEDVFTLVAPEVEGAEFVRWVIPEGSKIKFAPETNESAFKFAEGASAQDACKISALYKPVVSKVTVSVPAPAAEASLAEVNEATASIVLQKPELFANVPPTVAVSDLTWTPEDAEGKAQYETAYTAAATLMYKKTLESTTSDWECGYAQDVEVAVSHGEGTYEPPSWFDTQAHTAYVFFPETKRDDRHQTTIRDFAENDEGEGDPKVETWYEGETKYLVAKQYEDKLFTGWTITRTAQDTEDKDVTSEVLIAGDMATNASIGITVPVASETGDFPKGYGLSIVANYKEKVNELNVIVPQPMGTEATVSWTYDGTPQSSNLPVSWSISYDEDTSTGNKIVTSGSVATLHLSLEPEQLKTFVDEPDIEEMLDKGADENGPQIDYGYATCEKASDGLVITVPFVTTEETIGARTVQMQSCDVNTEDHARLDGSEDEDYFTFADDEDGVTLYAPDVEGGVFVGWEYDDNEVVVTDVSPDDPSVATVAFKPEAQTGDTYVVKALYKPVVDNVQVDFAAPKGGEQLAVYEGATAELIPQNDAFQSLTASVTSLTWEPASTDGKAGYKTKYTATLTYALDQSERFDYAEDVVGTYGDYLVDLSVEDPKNAPDTVYVDFDATEPLMNHKVTVINNAQSFPTTHYWQEGSTKHLVARPDDDKVFVAWKVTNEAGTDVTGEFLNETLRKNSTVAITLPQSNEGDAYPSKDYELTVAADYAHKADKLSITIDKSDTGVIGTTAQVTYGNDGAGSTVSKPVMWTRAQQGMQDDATYTATIRLDASEANNLKRSNLAVVVNDNPDQKATATWDDAGNLLVSTSFSGCVAPEGSAFRNVTVNTFDVNASTALTGSDALGTFVYTKNYDVLVLSGGKLTLYPHFIPGGTFDSWTALAGITSNGNEFTIGADQNDITIQANYKPIVNSAQININAPQKDEALAKSASASVTLANSAFSMPTVVASQFVWSPAAGSDGNASEDTEYEVAMKLKYQKSPSEAAAWSYAYVDGAYLTAPGSSYASLDTKKSDAYVLFAENATSNLISVDPVENLVVPYEKNKADEILQELQSKRKTVSIEANNGSDHSANITWETPKLVADGGKLNGAQWRARGKLTLPESVQAQDVYVYADITVEPATKFNLIHVDQPADVYDVAAGADEAAVRAVLETSTDLILEEGVIEQGTITWEKVECVDPEGTATYGAKWTATGKVSLPESVTNSNNVSLDVTMDVYTALAPAEENPIQMPYAMPEEDIYDQEKIITLHTDEPNGVIWYRIVDSDADTATNFVEYVDGSPIYLERETIDANDILVIEAYTMVGAQKSEDATFVYEFDTSVHIPEGDELVFDGTEQVGVWGYGDYTLMNPSSGARVDESGDACATNVGTYKVTAKLDSNREWFVDWPEDEAEPTTTTEDQVVAFSIVPASITYCDIDLVQNATYTGKAINPKPNLTLGDYMLVEGRDYTLSYSNNVNVGKAKVTITGKGNFIDSEVLEFEIIGEEPEPEPNPEPKPEPQPKPEPEPKPEPNPEPEPPAQLPVSYGGHAQTYGDLQAGKDGEVLGTTGQSKRLEAFWATVEGGSIEYRSHLQRIGWEDTWKRDGEISGTTGEARRLEAVQMRLSDQLTEAGYHVWYRTHSQTFGWLGWASDGTPAGTGGQSKRVEAIQVVVLRGDVKPEGYDASQTSFRGYVDANAHIQRDGWLGFQSAGEIGTTGQSKRLEAFWLKPGSLPEVSLEYCSHVRRNGWEDTWRRDGEISGTTGQSLRIEAVRIRLTGEDASKLSVWYRVHSQTFGWGGWAHDGEEAGTTGMSKRAEAIEIVVLSKDAAAPGSTENALRTK